MPENVKSGIFFVNLILEGVYVGRHENFIEKTVNIHLYALTFISIVLLLFSSEYQGISRDFAGKSSDSHLREPAAGPTERELPQKLAQHVPKDLSLHQDH